MALDGISLVTDGLVHDTGTWGDRLVSHGLIGSMSSVVAATIGGMINLILSMFF